ncbi:hypothetical protein GOY17_18400 [Lysobacter soli]|uniref:hypothetical protein n=1 Tax=Lysobacter soli TaxID=453783 RepID=UPI0012EDCEB4|nr:hypothetical protein [Lysobacter soli]QGW66686.1 hypothetical protein GOY17_18400 [Lysobacter soli]
MDAIFSNLADPSWWFTGLFFVAVSWAIKKSFVHGPSQIRGYMRGRKLANLRKIHSLRWNSLEITRLIGKAGANYVLFVAFIVVFLVLILFTPLHQALKQAPFFVTILLAMPIYIFEILWLIPDTRVREALKSRRKIRRLRSDA